MSNLERSQLYVHDNFVHLASLLLKEREKYRDEISSFYQFVEIVRSIKLEYEKQIQTLREKLQQLPRKLNSMSPKVKRVSGDPSSPNPSNFTTRPVRHSMSLNVKSYLKNLGEGGGKYVENVMDEIKHKELVKLDKKINKLADLLEQQDDRNHQHRTTILERRVVEVSSQKKIDDLNLLLSAQQNENNKLSQANNSLDEEIRKLDILIENEGDKVREMVSQKEEYKVQVEQWIREKRDVLKKKDDLIVQLTKKLMEMKQKLSITDVQILAEYVVDRYMGEKKREVKLRIEKNEIQIRDWKKISKFTKIPIAEVSRVYFGKEEGMFFIKYRDRTGDKLETLMSAKREEIVEKINNAIQLFT